VMSFGPVFLAFIIAVIAGLVLRGTMRR
jgi:hypothetical protein